METISVKGNPLALHSAMSSRTEWNRCRHVRGSREGHYESWFQRANHPERPLAFWIRYTIFSPKGRPEDAVGELWAIYFDGERRRIAAVKKALPMTACCFSSGDDDFDFRIGAATLTQDGLEGLIATEKHAIQWALRYAGDQAPMLLLPRKLYDTGFPKAKALVSTPNAMFQGVLTVDGDLIPIDGWRGSQNHNWGSKHTDSYAWGQVAGFDDAPDAFLECSTARLKLGPFWTPAMSPIVLRIDGREIVLNGITRALRAASKVGYFDWRIASQSRDARIELRIHAPQDTFVGLVYANPPGGAKTCLNSKLATCELTLEERGRPVRKFIARHRAAFEILTDRNDHGVTIVS